MGKKAREKRERVATPVPSVTSVSRTTAKVAVREPFHVEWPRWPAAGESVAWRLVAAVFVVALVIRVVALTQMTATPYLQIDTIDAKGYQVWAEQILAGEWLPGRHFYQSPLYAYYLAAVYALFGRSPWAPRVIQILLGSTSAALLVVIGARVFGRRVGVIAGVLLATYGPMILQEISLG